MKELTATLICPQCGSGNVIYPSAICSTCGKGDITGQKKKADDMKKEG